MTFSGIILDTNGPLQSPATSLMLILFPGFRLIQSLWLFLRALLNGPNTETSSGCRKWEQCGGKVSSTIPWFLAYSIKGKSIWLTWLSISISTVRSLVAPTWDWKWTRAAKKFSEVIQPDSWTSPKEPIGLWCVDNWGFGFFSWEHKHWRNSSTNCINKGNIVTFTPRFAETVCCTLVWQSKRLDEIDSYDIINEDILPVSGHQDILSLKSNNIRWWHNSRHICLVTILNKMRWKIEGSINIS